MKRGSIRRHGLQHLLYNRSHRGHSHSPQIARIILEQNVGTPIFAQRVRFRGGSSNTPGAIQGREIFACDGPDLVANWQFDGKAHSAREVALQFSGVAAQRPTARKSGTRRRSIRMAPGISYASRITPQEPITRLPFAANLIRPRRMGGFCCPQWRTRMTQIPHNCSKIPTQFGPAQISLDPLSFCSQPGSMMRRNCS
jgi:hypothetical protein